MTSLSAGGAERVGVRWGTRASACVAAILLLLIAPAHAQTPEIRHLIPPYDAQLDAVHAPAGFGTGRVWNVGPSRQFKKPSEVAQQVRDGDIVEIDAGVYTCDAGVLWRANFLTLVGVGGRAVLDATGCGIPGGKGIWNPVARGMIVDNIEFIGAAVGDANGAGIRYDGSGYLYITNSFFHDNQNGILYTPDFVANAGGVINVYGEVAGWTRERALRKADEIFDTTLSVYEIAKSQGILTYLAADKLAEQRIAAIRGLVKTWPQWPRKS